MLKKFPLKIQNVSTLTPDRSREKTADVILVSSGPLSKWIKNETYNGIERYEADGFTEPLPELNNRNLEQFWLLLNRESIAKEQEMTPFFRIRRILYQI